MAKFPVEELSRLRTPLYYYDTELLARTLETVQAEAARHHNFVVHYAIKSNANPRILDIISKAGLGADCVSGGEIEAASQAGFPSSKIVFAGVGKSDWEIELALDKDIFCFNVESIPELEVINGIAAKKGRIAQVCFRINPDVGAHTHANITTGLAENKFGIAMHDMDNVISKAKEMKNISFIGLHFHIGSQILEMDDFIALSKRINSLTAGLEKKGIHITHINVGGGLGIDYRNPDGNPVPEFGKFFDTYAENLNLADDQYLHFELGRSVTAQCGTMIARTLYVKQGTARQFCIVDAGFTELIRPAFYQAYHKIENLSSQEKDEKYDVVGPICESSDVFAKDFMLPKCHRGDLIAFRSAGAYGEIMASQYNCRRLPESYTDEDLRKQNN